MHWERRTTRDSALGEADMSAPAAVAFSRARGGKGHFTDMKIAEPK